MFRTEENLIKAVAQKTGYSEVAVRYVLHKFVRRVIALSRIDENFTIDVPYLGVFVYRPTYLYIKFKVLWRLRKIPRVLPKLKQILKEIRIMRDFLDATIVTPFAGTSRHHRCDPIRDRTHTLGKSIYEIQDYQNTLFNEDIKKK